MVGESINGVNQSVAYDNLGRVTSGSNALGNFIYSYAGASSLLTQANYPNGQTTSYQYTSSQHEKRLQQIHSVLPNGQTLSQHDYGYDAVGNITAWTRQSTALVTKAQQFGYDFTYQLLTVKEGTVAVNTYEYNAAGNRVLEKVGTMEQRYQYNNLNQLMLADIEGNSGMILFKGSVNKASRVKVQGQTVAVNPDNTFEAYIQGYAGINQVEVEATDVMWGNKRVNTYQFQHTGKLQRLLEYDADGNLTKDGDQSYQWDALNRLKKITYSDQSSTEFTYDGLSRRVKQLEKSASGTITSEKRLVWTDGNQPAEERDASNAVTRRYFAQGEQAANGDKFYYAKDHLGSIRELTDANSQVRAAYDYDAYGRRTKLTGDLDTIVAYTGHHYHAKSNLYLTWYRQYDPQLSRWLSRDLIDENGGINLYGYVDCNPIILIDLFGLDNLSFFKTGSIEAKMATSRGISKNKYTVAGHGDAEQMYDSNNKDNPISAKDLAPKIKADPSYNPALPVQLNSCSVGGPNKGLPNFAQQLANELDNTVIAPTDILTSHVFFGKHIYDSIEHHGKWKTFIPNSK
jgi:RHS repeat-associated protein